MLDVLNDFPQGKCLKRLHLKFNSAHFGDIRSNRKLIFEIGLHRKWKPEIEIWIDIPRFLAIYNRSPFGHCPITCQYCKINTLGPKGPARIVRGRLFRGVTVYIADLQMSDLGKSEHNSIHQKISTSYIYRRWVCWSYYWIWNGHFRRKYFLKIKPILFNSSFAD